jgi:hypothetical protein
MSLYHWIQLKKRSVRIMELMIPEVHSIFPERVPNKHKVSKFRKLKRKKHVMT